MPVLRPPQTRRIDIVLSALAQEVQVPVRLVGSRTSLCYRGVGGLWRRLLRWNVRS